VNGASEILKCLLFGLKCLLSLTRVCIEAVLTNVSFASVFPCFYKLGNSAFSGSDFFDDSTNFQKIWKTRGGRSQTARKALI